MRHILIFLSIILSPILSYSQTQRAESIVIPVSSMGDVTETRKQILQNTLEEKLKIFFKLISQERYEESQEKAFEELDFEHKEPLEHQEVSFGVTYENGLFLTVGDIGTILTSPDGNSWTKRTTGIPTNLRGVTYGKGLFVTVGG